MLVNKGQLLNGFKSLFCLAEKKKKKKINPSHRSPWQDFKHPQSQKYSLIWCPGILLPSLCPPWALQTSLLVFLSYLNVCVSKDMRPELFLSGPGRSCCSAKNPNNPPRKRPSRQYYHFLSSCWLCLWLAALGSLLRCVAQGGLSS